LLLVLDDNVCVWVLIRTFWLNSAYAIIERSVEKFVGKLGQYGR